MKGRHSLSDLIQAARSQKPAEVSFEDRQTFARKTVALWKRQCLRDSVPDLWLLWKRTSICSLAIASAVVTAIAVFHSSPPPIAENPFDVVLSDNAQATFF